MISPTKEQLKIFSDITYMLNFNSFKDLQEYSQIMQGVLIDKRVTEDFDFKSMAIACTIRGLENRIALLKHLQFEYDTVRPLIDEISRPYGS